MAKEMTTLMERLAGDEAQQKVHVAALGVVHAMLEHGIGEVQIRLTECEGNRVAVAVELKASVCTPKQVKAVSP